MKTSPLFSTAYLGPLAYYVRVMQGGVSQEVLRWEAHERFPKQSYRNRMYINGPNGLQMLSIPVSYDKTTLITEVEISYAEDWVKNHLKAIETAYGNAPFFDDLHGELKDILESRPRYLWELNTALHEWVCHCMRTAVPILPSNEFTTPSTHPFEEGDYRFCIHPKQDDPMRSLLLEYPQPFEREFFPGVSILDLLFMEGAWALDYLYVNWNAENAHSGK